MFAEWPMGREVWTFALTRGSVDFVVPGNWSYVDLLLRAVPDVPGRRNPP